MSLPTQTKYIIGTEACERFSFYGFKSILAVYMTSILLMEESLTISLVHLFLALTYLMPLAGAWVADRLLGRYKTILYVSLLYCLGHGVLGTTDLFESIEARRIILYIGLLIIGLGAGGIKPCVSSFMGDQIHDDRDMTKAYAYFYWSINFGSFFSFIVIPTVRDEAGWGWAFAIPGIAMAIATTVFWLGRRKYHCIPPKRESSGHSIWKVIIAKLFHNDQTCASRYGSEKVSDAKRMLRVFSIFIFVIPFWSLFDQTATTWVIQAKQMKPIIWDLNWIREGWSWVIDGEKFQSANPVFVMILVPLLTVVIYPHVHKWGRPLRRMGLGIVFAAISFLVVAWLQWRIESGEHISIIWQLIPYLLLTFGEVLLSTTGLEFAYTQAPSYLKSTLTSCWNLTIFFGNLLVAAITWIITSITGNTAVSSTSFLIYAGMAFAVTFSFILAARKYEYKISVAEE